MANEKNTKLLYPLLLYIFLEGIGASILMPFIGPLYLDTKTSVFPAHFSMELRQFIYGVTIVLSATAFFISSPIWGHFSDQYGRRPTLLIGLWCLIIGYFTCALGVWQQNYIILITGKMLLGFSLGSDSAAMAALCDGDESVKSNNLRWAGIMSCLGLLVGPLIGGYLASFSYYNQYQYVFPFIAIGVLSIFNYFWLYIFLKESYIPADDESKSSWLELLSLCYKAFFDQRIKVMIYAVFFSDIGFNVFFGYIGLYLVKIYQMTSIEIGYFLMVMVIGYFFNLLVIYPVIQKRIQINMAIKLMLIISAISLILMSFIMDLWVCYLLSLIAISTNAIKDTLLLLYFSEQVDEHSQGWVMGALGSIASIAAILSGSIISILSYFSPQIPILVSGILILISVWCMVFFLTERKKKIQTE